MLRFGKSFCTNSKKLPSSIGGKKYNLVHTKSQVKEMIRKPSKPNPWMKHFGVTEESAVRRDIFLINLWTWWWKWHVWSLSGIWLIRHFLVLPFSLSNHIYSFTLRYLTTFIGWRSFSSFIRFASVIIWIIRSAIFHQQNTYLSLPCWNLLLFLSDQLTRDGTHSERISKRPANNQVRLSRA